ncbi:MAG: hypothetical protein JSS35_05075 [Proteobacteria bacterium]|nr:hypothetical protein [Pseudomonadota bacterium]
MKSLIVMAALATAGLLAAQPAAAQAPASAQKAPKSPIDITADRLDTQNNDCVYTWTGSAEALRDTSRLRADVMIAHLEVKKDAKGAAKPAGSSSGPAGVASGNSCGEMTSLDAKGHVYYVSTDGKRVHGDNAHYDAASTTITITGDVTAVQGQNVMRGTKMVDNTQTGEGYVEGGARGAGAKNRPRAVLYPKDSDPNASGGQGPGGAASGGSSSAKPKKSK